MTCAVSDTRVNISLSLLRTEYSVLCSRVLFSDAWDMDHVYRFDKAARIVQRRDPGRRGGNFGAALRSAEPATKRFGGGSTTGSKSTAAKTIAWKPTHRPHRLALRLAGATGVSPPENRGWAASQVKKNQAFGAGAHGKKSRCFLCHQPSPDGRRAHIQAFCRHMLSVTQPPRQQPAATATPTNPIPSL